MPGKKRPEMKTDQGLKVKRPELKTVKKETVKKETVKKETVKKAPAGKPGTKKKVAGDRFKRPIASKPGTKRKVAGDRFKPKPAAIPRLTAPPAPAPKPAPPPKPELKRSSFTNDAVKKQIPLRDRDLTHEEFEDILSELQQRKADFMEEIFLLKQNRNDELPAKDKGLLDFWSNVTDNKYVARIKWISKLTIKEYNKKMNDLIKLVDRNQDAAYLTYNTFLKYYKFEPEQEKSLRERAPIPKLLPKFRKQVFANLRKKLSDAREAGDRVAVDKINRLIANIIPSHTLASQREPKPVTNRKPIPPPPQRKKK